MSKAKCQSMVLTMNVHKVISCCCQQLLHPIVFTGYNRASSIHTRYLICFFLNTLRQFQKLFWHLHNLVVVNHNLIVITTILINWPHLHIHQFITQFQFIDHICLHSLTNNSYKFFYCVYSNVCGIFM